MQATAEPLEDNRVRLKVEVGEEEIEKDLRSALQRLARQIRVPGFRPGKVPTAVIEARMGKGYLRREALRELIPGLYERAAKDVGIEPIALRELEITGGETEGPVTFDVVVEVRPKISVAGYEGLQVRVPSPVATEAQVDEQIDKLRGQFAQLEPVARPAKDGDVVTIDLTGYRHNVIVDALTTPDYVYEVGSGRLLPELDEELRGAKAGDILQRNVNLDLSQQDAGEAGQGAQEVTLKVLVKEVREKVLPPLDDDWVQEATEFQTVDELRADVRRRLEMIAKVRSRMAFEREAVRALGELVTEALPEALVDEEVSYHYREFENELRSRRTTIQRWLKEQGLTEQEVRAQLRPEAENHVRTELALDALVEAEAIEPSEEDMQKELERLAEGSGRSVEDIRDQVERNAQWEALRSSLKRSMAVRWLLEHVEVVDEDGNEIDRALLLGDQDEKGQGASSGEGTAPPGSVGDAEGAVPVQSVESTVSSEGSGVIGGSE
jgi:trigger factor